MAVAKSTSVRFPLVELFTGDRGPVAYIGGRLKEPSDVVLVNGATPIFVADLLYLWAQEPDRTALEASRALAYLRHHERVTAIRRQA